MFPIDLLRMLSVRSLGFVLNVALAFCKRSTPDLNYIV